MKKFGLLVSLLSIICISGCDKLNEMDMNHVPNNSICQSSSVKLIFNKESESLSTTLACSNAQKMKGLMNIKSLPQNSGMTFVFDNEQTLSFWMKDTNINLSIAFIDKDWKIVDIKEMKAFDEKSVTSKSPALYAVEANEGWFTQQHIKIGDQISLDLH